MKKVKIRNRELEVPIIQGGMGVGVSLSRLSGNVMLQGGLGVISSAHPGYKSENFKRKTKQHNHDGLLEEIKKARAISPNRGLLGVNVMVALHDYDDLVKTAVEGQVDVIISGAGLPLSLPGLTKGSDVAIAPIVSSGKAARLLCRSWDKEFNVTPDFVVIEGPKAGGHLGFKLKDLENMPELKDILIDVLAELKPYEEKYGREIPVFVAGGVFDGKDIAKYIQLGASGVQMATRFIATYESDCDDLFKQALIKAKKEDIQLVKSPVGLPGRAIRTPLVEQLEQGNIPVAHCYHCLKPCNPATTDYCISDALIKAAEGNYDEGLFFSGSEGYRITQLMHVEDLINELVNDANEVLNHE